MVEDVFFQSLNVLYVQHDRMYLHIEHVERIGHLLLLVAQLLEELDQRNMFYMECSYIFKYVCAQRDHFIKHVTQIARVGDWRATAHSHPWLIEACIPKHTL